MDLDNRYDLLEVVANDSESKTFRARETATGCDVLVHLMFGGQGVPHKGKLLDLVLQRVVDPSPDRRRQILEISDYKGMPYAVTEVLPGFRSLREWLEAERQPEAPGPPAAASAPPDPLAMTGRWAVPGGEKPPVPAPAPAPEPAAAVPSPPPLREPAPPRDDFDRLFGAPPPAPSPPGKAEPGEFTRLFGAAPGSTPTVLPPPPPAAPPPPGQPPSMGRAEPGEFTRLFGASGAAAFPSMGGPSPQPEGPAPAFGAPPQPLPPPAGGQAGEFTRLFGPRAGPAAPLPAGPAAPAAGSATQAFGLPAQTVQPSGPPVPQGPSEYTALFGSPGARPAYQAPPAPPSPLAATPSPQPPQPVPLTRRPYFVPLLIAGNVLFLLVLSVLLYFLLKR